MGARRWFFGFVFLLVLGLSMYSEFVFAPKPDDEYAQQKCQRGTMHVHIFFSLGAEVSRKEPVAGKNACPSEQNNAANGRKFHRFSPQLDRWLEYRYNHIVSIDIFCKAIILSCKKACAEGAGFFRDRFNFTPYRSLFTGFIRSAISLRQDDRNRRSEATWALSSAETFRIMAVISSPCMSR